MWRSAAAPKSRSCVITTIPRCYACANSRRISSTYLLDLVSRAPVASYALQVDMHVIDCLPQPLDENVVAPVALAIHADCDAVNLDQADELEAGELAALAGVEDVWASAAGDNSGERLDSEVRRQAV